MPQASLIWMNGEFVPYEDAKVHVLTHALHYGTGVFEGIRAYETPRGTAIFRHQDHIERLFRSAGMYFMDIPYSREEIRAATHETIQRNGFKECYIRPLVFRGAGPMGLYPLDCPVEVIDRGLGVGLLPRRRGQAERRPRPRVLVAAAAQRRRDPRRQGDRPVPQLGARQDRGRQGRLRGGDPPRHATATSARAPARTCSSSRTGSSPRRPTCPACSAASTGAAAIQIARDLGFELAGAPGRPRRALPRRRDLHDRHRGRAHAGARGRRPARRHGRAGRDHARGPARRSRTRCTAGRSATPTGTTWCPCPRRPRERDPRLRLHPPRRHAGGGDVAVRRGEAARRAPPRRPRRADDRGGLPGLEPEGGRAVRAARDARGCAARSRRSA